MTSPHVALHITFRTYGSWLHGDGRGSINRKGKTLKARHVPPNRKLEALERLNMTQPPVVLDGARRGCVRRAIESFCEYKGWKVLAVNVRTNHVHALVAGDAPAKRMLGAIKAAATRALRDAGLVDGDARVWSYGGGISVCGTEKAVLAARHYVLHQQGPDLPEA